MQKSIIRLTAFLMVAALITACASNGKGMAQNGEDCSAAKSAGFGALVGGLLGAAVDGKKGAKRGAAAGAIVGGLSCMVMNYQTEKVRSAAQVNQAYKAQNKKLPVRPVVTEYSLAAPHQAMRGKRVDVNSKIVLIDGRYEPVHRVKEKLFIVNAQGERKEIKTKNAQQAGMDAGGEYINAFSFTPPKGVAQGNYRLESEVYVNESLAKSATTPLVIASHQGELIFIALHHQ